MLRSQAQETSLTDDALNVASFRNSFVVGGRDGLLLITRAADQPTDHLFALPPPLDDGLEVETADVVLALDTSQGSITLAFADGGKRYDAQKIKGFLWPEGAPQDRPFDEIDLHTAFLALIHSRMGEQPERWNDLPMD